MIPDTAYVQFLQTHLPLLGLRWQGFRKVRGQVIKRLKRRLKHLQLHGVEEYAAYLDTHAAEWRVLDSMCRISISRFYRDKGVFKIVQEDVLPQLAEAVRAEPEPVLRCWSAGCASGEEVYTLQLLWQLSLAARYPAVRVQIVATDIDPHMLARARQGCYAPGSLKELPPQWVEAGFEQRGASYVIREAFRAGISFIAQDIRQELPAGFFHVVLCRNLVCTYFALPVQRRVLAGIAARLVPGGFLLLGTHEQLPPGSPDFVPYAGQQGLFRKVATAGVTRG
jgi:chemotaxis protein methyltransferase CheR